MKPPLIYCIVVTYNGIHWIDRCLQSIYESSVSVKIIVIDNASTDGTPAHITSQFQEVILIENSKNLGFGKANNLGLRKAIADEVDFVFLLNQDARVEKYCIEKLIAYYQRNKEFSILSPYHFNYEGNGLELYFEQYVLRHYTKNYNNPAAEVYESSFVHAAAWMLPIDTIRKVGGFDPLFQHTGEDNDYIQRLLFSKLKIGILTNAYFYHNGTNLGLNNYGYNYIQFLNADLLRLKNPNATLLGAFALFYFKIIINCLRFNTPRKLDLKIQYKIFLFVIKNTCRIITSRLEQAKANAYLSN